jgi:Tfp pilus assembly protein PilW
VAAKLSNRRVGLTLLELILALSLSVVLLFAVGMALRLYWRSFDTKRTNIEQSHLARAILQKMGDDLRSAVQYTPVDLSGLESIASTSSLAGAFAGMTGTGSPAAAGAGGSGAGGGAGTGGGTGAGTGGGAGPATSGQSSQGQSGQGGAATSGAAGSSSTTKSGGSTSTPSSSSTAGGSGAASGSPATGSEATGEQGATESTQETPPAVVGLYGTATQIQFDVSRLPRVDEYAGNSPTSMVKIPSDIKTVSYYVRNGEAAALTTTSTFGSTPATGSSEPSTSGQGRGLMRLEIDRAVSAYSETGGTVASNYDQAKLLADEVTSIAFQYWDGTAWASEWNSDEMGGLPLAVEIVMTLADPNAEASTAQPTQNFGATSDTESTDPSYRIVVALPTASLPPPPAEEPETTEGSTTPGSSSAASSSLAPGFGGSGAGSAPASSGSTKSGSSGSASYGTGSTIPGGSK